MLAQQEKVGGDFRPLNEFEIECVAGGFVQSSGPNSEPICEYPFPEQTPTDNTWLIMAINDAAAFDAMMDIINDQSNVQQAPPDDDATPSNDGNQNGDDGSDIVPIGLPIMS